MRKYGPRYFDPDFMVCKNHWAEGTEWTVQGSKDNVYTVKLTPRGFTCDCVGMTMHGKCKHTRTIAEKFVETEFST